MLVSPRVQELHMLGLGGSDGLCYLSFFSASSNDLCAVCSGTPNGSPLIASAIVVKSFDDLKLQAQQNKTQGKIVVLNPYCDWAAMPVGCYSLTAQYRTSGATEAARVGAVGVLVRTLASYSLNTPHTGLYVCFIA